MVPVISKEETGENLNRLFKERGLTVKNVQEYMGLASVQSVYHWINGISMPTIDNLYALSELLEVTIDDIVCGNRSWHTPRISLDYIYAGDGKERLYAYYMKLSKAVA